MEYIHLLSSAARSLYAQDIVRVLAMPRGAVLRFRYSKELVHDAIVKMCQKKEIVGKKVLISFLDVSDRARVPGIFPCRVGNVTKCWMIAGFLVIEFKVEAFAVSCKPESFRATISDLLRSATGTVELPTWVGEGEDGSLTGHWAFESTGELSSMTTAYDTEAFASVTHYLAGNTPFRLAGNEVTSGTRGDQDFYVGPFFHAVLFENDVSQYEHGDILHSPRRVKIRDTTRSLHLKGGEAYTLAIVHYHREPGASRQVEPRKLYVTLRHVTNISNEVRNDSVTSEYDLKPFQFETANVADRSDASIEVHLANEEMHPSKKFCDIVLPVVVEPNWKAVMSDAIVRAIPASIAATAAVWSAGIAFVQYSNSTVCDILHSITKAQTLSYITAGLLLAILVFTAPGVLVLIIKICSRTYKQVTQRIG